MKQLLFILAFLIGACVKTHAETVKLVPSAGDSTRMDTVVISEIQDDEADYDEADIMNNSNGYNDADYLVKGIEFSSSLLLISILMGCGLPLFIVVIALWFRYKNKQAKYKLAAQALAAGQNIPQELFNDPKTQQRKILSKGIKNIFLGIGLGVLLWAMTNMLELAAIGFLIFCMGIGQVLIAYATSPKDAHTPTQDNRNPE